MVSPVWNFFTKECNDMARCNNPLKQQCQTPLKRTKGNTKSLWNHLLLVHGMTKTSIEEPQEKQPKIDDILPSKKINSIETLDSYISCLVSVDMIPINRIAKSQRIKNLLNHKFSHCDLTMYFIRNTITRHASHIRNIITSNIKKILCTNNSKINISFDEWTGRSSKQYITINAHLDDMVFCLGKIDTTLSLLSIFI